MRIGGLQTHNPFHRPTLSEQGSQADFAETLRLARERARPDRQGQDSPSGRAPPGLNGGAPSLGSRDGNQPPGAFPSDPTFPSDTLKQEAGHRAFGLDELGLFGSSWAVAAPDEEVVTAVGLATDSPAGPVEPSNPDASQIPAVPGAGAATRAMTPAAADSVAIVSAAKIRPSTQASNPDAELVRFEPTIGEGDNEASKPAGAATSRLRETPRRAAVSQMAASEVSLLISEQGGSLEVVAAAPRMSTQDRSRLTQAVSELAARLGRPLTKLSLNGTLLFASLAKGIGADHGRSSR